MTRFRTSARLLTTFLFYSLFSSYLFAQGQMPMDTIKGPDYTLIVPRDITVECSAIPTLADPIVITNCPNAKSSALFDEFSSEEECSANYIIFRMWDIYTPCQKHFEVTQEIYVVDTKAPTVANFPADLPSSCSTLPAVPTLVWTDNCSANPVVKFQETTQNVGTSTKVLRTWTAADPCGNVTSKTQSITMADNASPYFTNSIKDVTVDCAAVPSVAKPVVADACDKAPTVTFVETKTAGTCINNYSIKRTWTAKDATGNTAILNQSIVVQDKRAPTFTAPTNVTVDCAAVPKAATATSLKIADNCTTGATVTMNEVKKAGICINNYTLSRTFTVTDKCNNKLVKTQVVTVADKKFPTLANVPADVTVSCTAVPTISVAPTAADNCSKNVVLAFKEGITPGTCPDNYTIKRTWTMTDECKNTSTRTQTVVVADKLKPSFVSTPTDISVAVSQGNLMKISNSATDNCDKNVMISFSEQMMSSAPTVANGQCTKYLMRTWLATDNCKNTASVSQNLYVTDDVAPVIYNAPTDLTLDCGVTLPVAPTNVYALDTMGLFKDNISVTFYEKTTPGGCNGFSNVERFWTALDACNNAKTVTQKITFVNGASAQGLVALGGGDKALDGQVSKGMLKAEIEAPTQTENVKILKGIDSQSVTTVEVFTFEGKQVFVADNFGRAVIQLNQHPAGIYIMKISDGKNTQVKKFMKQ